MARWPGYVMTRSVRIGEGAKLDLVLGKIGPAADARERILDTVVNGRGLPRVIEDADRIESDGLLVAAVRGSEGRPRLLLARVAASGAVVVAATELNAVDEQIGGQIRATSAALLVQPVAPEVSVDLDGTAEPATGLTEILFGVGLSTAVDAARLTANTEPGPVSVASPFWRRWWFWTIVGVAVLGAGIGTGAALAGGDATTTNFRVEIRP